MKYLTVNAHDFGYSYSINKGIIEAHTKGKKLFANGTVPLAFSLTDTTVTPKGVIFANYKRAGSIKTGTVIGRAEP